MILLNPGNYHKLEQTLKSVQMNHLFAQTVIEQKMDGEIYVDDLEKPSTVYVKHQYGMALLFGRTDNLGFNQDLINYLLNKNNARKTGEWLQVFPTEWNTQLEELLASRLTRLNENPLANKQNIILSTRVNFRFNKSNYMSATPSIPPN